MNPILVALRATRDTLTRRVEEIVARAEGERRDLTERELNECAEARGQLNTVADRILEVLALEDRRDNAVLADQDVGRRGREVDVISEPRTYDGRPGGPSVLVDMYRSQRLGDMQALERLQRHAREESIQQRDVGTGAFGGLVVPQHLVGEFAPVLRNGRAFANACRPLPLPAEGMTLIVPRGETGVTVEPQATQNIAVSETDVDYDNDLTIPVRTFAGQQDVSRQTLERGTPEIDRLIFGDLVAAYAARLDSSIINDDGTVGTHDGVRNATGINSVTYTDATPTVIELWSKLADAVQQIGSNRKASANLIVMHPRRWGWILAARDTQDRPLIIHGNASDAVNAMGEAAADFGEGQLVGTLMGLPVLMDGNIPTTAGAGTEDVIIVCRREDALLWEDGGGMPRQLRFEEPLSGSLTVKLVAYGYSAFSAERYASGFSVISGSGLIAPVFA